MLKLVTLILALLFLLKQYLHSLVLHSTKIGKRIAYAENNTPNKPTFRITTLSLPILLCTYLYLPTYKMNYPIFFKRNR